MLLRMRAGARAGYLDQLRAVGEGVLAFHVEDPHSEPHALDSCHAELAQLPLLVHGQYAGAVGPCNKGLLIIGQHHSRALMRSSPRPFL